MMKKFLPVLLIVVAVSAIGYAWWHNHEMTAQIPNGIAGANGRLELERYDVATLRPGKVIAVSVTEGENIQAGEVIARLSSDELQAKLAAAKAAKARAESAVMRAKSAQARAEGGKNRALGGIKQAQAEISAQNAQLAIAQEDLQNARHLRREKLISAAELNQREKARAARQAAVNAATAAKLQAQAGEGEANAAIAEAKAGTGEAQAAVAQAEAEIHAVEVYIQDLTITSPQTGLVAYTVAQVGNVVAPGSVIATIVDPTNVSMSVFLPTRDVGKIIIGDEARIVIDGLDAVFPARVIFIAEAAQFTPKYVETANERENMMYRVKVKIDQETARQYAQWLKGGLTAVGYIRYDKNAAWPEKLAVKLPPLS